MSKTTSINVRIEPELKEEVELILQQLGLPISSAVNMFLRQVVMQRGIPFDIKIPITKPVNISDLTEDDLNLELQKGYTDYTQGNTKSADKAFSYIHEDYRI